ncbi:MAG: HAD-IIIC family phosphatase [Bacteroidales bacterium]|nr:HAD-IIIC family phosphatase [Bacteroidales bacterium]
MNWFVFRNNTVERFFPKGYAFSGYEDVSAIPADADGYVWFYQAPLGADRAALGEVIRGYGEKFRFVLEQVAPGKPFVVLTMTDAYDVPLTEDDHSLAVAVAAYNAGVYEAEERCPQVKVVDFNEFARNYPASELLDWKFFFISQMGLNPRLTKDFQAWWNRKLDSIALRRKKCLVLDLDNTLWGGVLGEDGISGIRIGGDYPGKAFLFFQEALLALSRSGVILAVCSKNNEADVLEAWEKNPYLVLRKEHFAAWRINWNDKAANLRELADELNIGLDSFVFLDDNPAERELIRQLLPMVAVPDFPAQPYELPAFFRQCVADFFKVYSVTEEDRQKVAQYKANAARSRAQQRFSDLASFLESLDIRITIAGADAFNIPRIAQMTQKTNQFNLTTKRYADTDIQRFVAEGWRVWCLRAEDRFGDNGITGVILIDGDAIDSLLLSCRILGKGIEQAFLKAVLARLKDEGVKTVRARYCPTAKNAQVRDFYERCGFACVAEEPDGEKTYELDLDSADLEIEKYYQIIWG